MADSKSIEKEIKSLSNLIQYKDKDYHWLRRKAIENLKKKELINEFVFSDRDEKKQAQELFSKYMEDNSFDNISELNDLKSLVYNEILSLRLQKNLAIATENNAIPKASIEANIGLQKQITEQKKNLGLIDDDSETSDAFLAYTTLIQKVRNYQEEHPDEFVSKCPCCQKIIMWERRVKDYSSKEHPLIRENRPWNKKIIQLINENKLSKQDAAEILDTSVEFIEKDLLKRKIQD